MKKLSIIILSFLLLSSCSKKTSKDYKEMMKENNYIIIDVRTKEEYSLGHIKDAMNIPYNEINKDSDIPKNKTIFVYCKSGARSKKAYGILLDLGYDVYDLGAYESIDLPKE